MFFFKDFQRVLTTGKLPEIWATGFIDTIHKSGPKDDPSNFRGIAICSCIGILFLNTK